MTAEVIARLERRLIVSCQAPADSPLHPPAVIAALAQCAERGGAGGVRVDGPENVTAVRQVVGAPVIGIYKVEGAAPIYITPTFERALQIARAGADIIAVQATRERGAGDTPLDRLVARIHSECGLPVMADVSTIEEGIAAAEAGADLVATTMAGYTPHSRALDGPDLQLVRNLARQISVPVVAEGRIRTPEEAAAALRAGAWAVVVGRAITMPDAITAQFALAVRAAARRSH